jgi:hypothetical protein
MLMKKALATLMAATAALIVEGNTAHATNVVPSKPHVLFIVADDHGFHDCSFTGSAVKTPTIDKLRWAGIALEQHYVQKVRATGVSQATECHTGVTCRDRSTCRGGVHDTLSTQQSLCVDAVQMGTTFVGQRLHSDGFFKLHHSVVIWPTVTTSCEPWPRFNVLWV